MGDRNRVEVSVEPDGLLIEVMERDGAGGWRVREAAFVPNEVLSAVGYKRQPEAGRGGSGNG